MNYCCYITHKSVLWSVVCYTVFNLSADNSYLLVCVPVDIVVTVILTNCYCYSSHSYTSYPFYLTVPIWFIVYDCLNIVYVLVDLFYSSSFIVIVSPSHSLSFIFSHPWSLALLKVRILPYRSSSNRLADRLLIVKFLFMLISLLPCSHSTVILYISMFSLTFSVVYS